MQFYCDGVFYGFSIQDIQRSPVIAAWLQHELQYGKLQRRYCREWFSYLSNGNIQISDDQLAAPIDFSIRYRKNLTSQIAERLWAKIKHDDLCAASYQFEPKEIWSAASNPNPNFIFLNLNKKRQITKTEIENLTDDSFLFLLRQYIARFDYQAFPAEATDIFTLMKQNKSLAIGKCLLKNMKRVPLSRKEPVDIFLYN